MCWHVPVLLESHPAKCRSLVVVIQLRRDRRQVPVISMADLLALRACLDANDASEVVVMVARLLGPIDFN